MVRYPTWLIVTLGLLFSSLSAQIALTSIDPDSAAQGDNLSVYIIGQGTNFTQGTGVTSVWFSQGSSTIFSYYFWPGSATTLTAYFEIPIDALMGLWDLSVNSSEDGTLTLTDGFRIFVPPPPYIEAVYPDSGYQANDLWVSIYGRRTNFRQGSGTTAVWLENGAEVIQAENFWAYHREYIDAIFRLPHDALTGLWDLSVTDAVDGTLTLVDGFTIFPFTAAPEITNISDVPADQGRWLHVTWNASDYDLIHINAELTQYGIWELDLENNWVSLGSTPAIQSSAYTYLARAYGDSSSQGIFWSRFKITAHTDAADRYYTSEVDSGYSVDNLAPAVPDQLMAVKLGKVLSLSWSEAVDEDFNNFRIYRSEVPGSDMTGTQPLAEMVAPEYADTILTTGVTYYYRVSAMDANGNESHLSDEFSSSTLSLSSAEAIPTDFALHQNYPNPFNPSTLLRYDLPVPSNVNFSIYDLMGREVASLVLGEQGPGFHSIVWQGKDGTGRQAPSGIYIARLVTAAYTKSIKMVLLK